MLRSVAARSAVAAVSVFAVACSQSPTAPTSVAGSVTVGTVTQEPPAVPAAIVPTPPQALGATRFDAFGDSITAGVLSSFDGLFLYDDTAGSYPSLLRGMLQTYSPGQASQFAVWNDGVPGEGASQAEGRLRTVLSDPTRRPQALLLLEGVNDMIGGGVSGPQAAASVHQLVQIARLFNVTVLVATMPQTYYSVAPDGRIRENARTQIVPFNTELRRLVSGLQNVHVVDLYAAFGTDRSLMGNDGLHPTPAGYARMAQTFHAAIVSVFPVRGSLQ
jgi:lysophospholipase L1-like esterase